MESVRYDQLRSLFCHQVINISFKETEISFLLFLSLQISFPQYTVNVVTMWAAKYLTYYMIISDVSGANKLGL